MAPKFSAGQVRADVIPSALGSRLSRRGALGKLRYVAPVIVALEVGRPEVALGRSGRSQVAPGRSGRPRGKGKKP